MELVHRIRWANVARVAAVVGAVALIVAWPRLRSGAPAMPASEPTPVVVDPPPAAEPRSAETNPGAPPPARSGRSGARGGDPRRDVPARPKERAPKARRVVPRPARKGPKVVPRPAPQRPKVALRPAPKPPPSSEFAPFG